MKKIIISTICIFCFALGSVAQTDSSKKNKYVAPWFVERFRISAGAFFPINNTVVQVSGTAAGHTAGTEINFERDLGFTKHTSTFVADAQYRLKRRSRFDLSYYRINRTSGHTLDKDIIFKDDTFHVNTSINSFFKTNIIRFSYGYSLIEKPTFELGLLIGTHVVSSDVGLEVNGTNVGFEQQQSFGFTAPLPDAQTCSRSLGPVACVRRQLRADLGAHSVMAGVPGFPEQPHRRAVRAYVFC